MAAIIGAFVTNRLGVSYFNYHVWFGYTVIEEVCFVCVGFYRYASRAVLEFHLRPRRYFALCVWAGGARIRYAGHNPLGAWMVVTLLTPLGIQRYRPVWQ